MNNLKDEKSKKILDKENNITKIKKNQNFWKFSAFFIIIIGLFIIIIPFLSCFDKTFLIMFGTFSGGIVAALWSLAGILLIFVAFLGQQIQIIQQGIELEYMRMEYSKTTEMLKMQKEEMRGQKEEMKLQNKLVYQQTHENTFFKMFNTYLELMDTAKGEDKSILIIERGLSHFIKNSNGKLKKDTISEHQRLIGKFEIAIDLLENVFKWLDKSNYKEKDFHKSIVLSTMNDNVVYLLRYFSIKKDCLRKIINDNKLRLRDDKINNNFDKIISKTID
jgi:hypothetical protein